MELDFSKLEGISHRMVVETPQRNVKAPQAQGGIDVPPTAESPATGRSGFQKTYGAMYRAAYDFHKQHSPPTVDAQYWKTHTAGADEIPDAEREYWERTSQDIVATANQYGNDPFLMGLLGAVYDELGKEYEKRRS